MDRNDVDWNGYWIATTTPFKKDGSLDEAALRHGMRSYPEMGIKGVLVGSVTERVVRHAPCPVLCVKPEGYESPLQDQFK